MLVFAIIFSLSTELMRFEIKNKSLNIDHFQ